MSVWNIFKGFLEDTLDAVVNEVLTFLEGLFGDLFDGMFFVERVPGLEETPLTEVSISQAMNILYGFLVLLLALKLLWKGTKVYVLWRDGEAETPPTEMILGAVYALVAAVAFPVLYELAAMITREILDTVCGVLFSGGTQWSDDVFQMAIQALTGTLNLPMPILGLIFAVQLVCLVFVMLKQGAELLLFRLGIPFAAVGLIDSDGGCWKPYMQTFFRMLATALVRWFCLYLGIRLAASLEGMGLILGVVFEVLSFTAPKLLSQFLTPQGGGGAAQKISTIVMAVRTFAGI